LPRPESRKENRRIIEFLAALRFLTSIPLPAGEEASPEQLGRATAYFPVVGLIIGLILAGVKWLFDLILPDAVVSALVVAALVVITGALHLDGLADTCDGIAGHKTVEERWEVMRDSRAGAFGIAGVVLVLIIKYTALDNIPTVFMTAILLFMPVASRWAIVYALFTFRYAHKEGLGTVFKQATRWPQFTAATIFTLAVAAALYPVFSFTGFLIIGGTFIIATGVSFYLKNKFAGLTGDTYGAINETTEATALIMAIPFLHCTG
jgi:adenosylcobinamide-GDP ribazoletransferase